MTIDGGQREELMNYVDFCRLISKYDDEEDDSSGKVWIFLSIEGHKRTAAKTWDVLVKWDTGETTWEPLRVIAKDDPVSCARYAKDNGLLSTPGWKQFRRFTKTDKRFVRAL